MTLLLLLNEGYLTHYILDPMCIKHPNPFCLPIIQFRKWNFHPLLIHCAQRELFHAFLCFNLNHYSLKLMKIVNVMSRNIRIFLIHTTGVCWAAWWSGSLLGWRFVWHHYDPSPLKAHPVARSHAHTWLSVPLLIFHFCHDIWFWPCCFVCCCLWFLLLLSLSSCLYLLSCSPTSSHTVPHPILPLFPSPVI